MPDTKLFLKRLKRIVFYLLPVLLLYLVLSRVDLALVLENLRDTVPVYVLLGLVIRPVQMMLGAFRWRLIANHCGNTRLPKWFMLREYWAGVAVGYFTPGSIGWDAYRVMVLGRKLDTYTAAFATIVSEKVIGLLSVLTLFLIMFPLVVDQMDVDTTSYRQAHMIMMLVLLAGALLVTVVVNSRTFPLTRRLRAYGDQFALNCIRIIKNERIAEAICRDLHQFHRPWSILRKPWLFAATLLYSAGGLVIAAVCSQFIFRGLNYDIHFSINLFAGPVLFVVFVVPISFGSIGVREGAFILVYGLFGVPMEIALLVSFFNLLGLMLNNAIGAALLWRTEALAPDSASSADRPRDDVEQP